MTNTSILSTCRFVESVEIPSIPVTDDMARKSSEYPGQTAIEKELDALKRCVIVSGPCPTLLRDDSKLIFTKIRPGRFLRRTVQASKVLIKARRAGLPSKKGVIRGAKTCIPEP
jgi:hypothetical protein